MRALLMILSFGVAQIAIGETIESLGEQAVRKTVSGVEIENMVYCSGFHCYHYAVDLCGRISENQCRVAEIGVNVRWTSGHAQNVIRSRVQRDSLNYDVFCIYEPQQDSKNSKSVGPCWSHQAKDPVNEASWAPSKDTIRSYCKSNPARCDNEGNTGFKISAGADLQMNPYEGWWENIVKSNGQLLRVCDRRNEMSKPYALPSKMPLCSELIKNKCSKVGVAQACKGPAQAGGDLCLVFVCADDGFFRVSNWDTLPLPLCTVGELGMHCKEWAKLAASSLEMKVRDQYIFKYTSHYCRHSSSKRLQIFGCDKDLNPTLDPAKILLTPGLPTRNDLPSPSHFEQSAHELNAK